MNEDTIKSVAYRLRQDENRKIACPACVDAGKDKHDLSMSVINKGDYALYKCHRDDSHNGRINFEGRKRAEPPPEKPTEKIDPSEKELSAGQRWIEQVRGIPFERVEQFVSFGSAYFKQANGSLPCIEFVYKDENGKKVYSKFRSIEGKYFTSGHSTPGGTDTLYLTEAVNYEKPYLIITEGECLTGDTEVLTPSGWAKIEDVTSDEIAQWNADGQIKFVRPLAKIEKDYEGLILNFKNNSVSCSVTPLHRMPGILNGELRFRSAAERASGSYRHEQLPRAGILDGPGIPLLDDQISFCLAISADASIDVRKCNPAVKTGVRAKESRYARISFKKTRKIERFESLLLSLGLDYTKTVQPSRPDMTFFGVSLPEWVPGRKLPWEWISNATIRQRKFILEELIEWDGNRVPNRTQTEYSSKSDHNAQFVQTLCHTSGICSSVIKRKNAHGKWNKVSILNGKSYSTYQQFKSESKNFVGKVYCFTVPSGMFLIRHNGMISVTGNCDALTLKAAGFNAVSMPTGANVKWLAHNQNLLSKFQRVLVWFDADAKGGTVAEKLKLQPPKLIKNFMFLNPKKLAELCPNSKDANEVLLAHGTGLFKQILATCFEKHTPDYVIRPSSLMKGLVRVRDNTYANRVGINSPALDEVISLVRGYAGLVTGIPGHGKALALDTEIPTPDGFTTMEKIKVGDVVYDENGRLCNVTNISEIHHHRPCFKLVFDDGTTIVADANHQWLTVSEKARRSSLMARRRLSSQLRPRGTDQSHKRTFPSIVTTEEISNSIVKCGKINHQIPTCEALEGVDVDFPIKPYTLGVWLGDGDSESGCFTSFDDQVLEEIRRDGYRVTAHKKEGRYTIRGIVSRLRGEGLLGNKRIPPTLLRASPHQRLEIMKGLMDSDGTCEPRNGRVEFTTIKKGLAEDFFDLCAGLGFKPALYVSDAKLNGRIICKNYRISFSPRIPVFKLQRKIDRQNLSALRRGNSARVTSRRIVSCERTASVPVKCIEVDSPSHLFLVTRSFIATHNSTFLSWYAYKRAEIYGHKTVFWSPENDPTLLTADIIGMAAGRLVKGHAGALPMSDHELQTHAAFADSHFRVVQDCEEGSDIDSVLNQMQAAALDMGGADLYIIDPFNYLKLPTVQSKNSLDAIKIVYSKIRRFAVANDCSVILVAHPKKMDEIETKKRDDEDDASRSESHEENGMKRYKMPGMYSISGSADFANMADFVIVVHREESHTTIANVKSRRPFLGTMGASCAVAYRPSAGDFRVLSGARFDASGWEEPDGAPF